jgi:hypothetical protein
MSQQFAGTANNPITCLKGKWFSKENDHKSEKTWPNFKPHYVPTLTGFKNIHVEKIKP